MAWSTKGAIIGDLHDLQVNRHYPHHFPSICSFWEQDLSILQDFLRIYGFEGGGGGGGGGEDAHLRIKLPPARPISLVVREWIE